MNQFIGPILLSATLLSPSVAFSQTTQQPALAPEGKLQGTLIMSDPIEGAPPVSPFIQSAIDQTLLTELIGQTVYSQGAERQEIGQITDVVIGQSDQKIGALLDIGGFLGFNDQLVAISLDQLSWVVRADGEPVLETALSQKELEAAPEFDIATAERVVEPEVLKAEEKATLQDAGLQAKDIIGMDVRDRENNVVGEVNDLIISEDSSIEALLVDISGFFGLTTAKTVAVEFKEIEVTRSTGAEKWEAIVTPLSSDEFGKRPEYQGPAPKPGKTITKPIVE